MGFVQINSERQTGVITPNVLIDINSLYSINSYFKVYVNISLKSFMNLCSAHIHLSVVFCAQSSKYLTTKPWPYGTTAVHNIPI